MKARTVKFLGGVLGIVLLGAIVYSLLPSPEELERRAINRVTSNLSPFPTECCGFNILILPFDRSEDHPLVHSIRPEDVWKEHWDSLSRALDLNLNVRIAPEGFESTTHYLANFVGADVNADLVLFGSVSKVPNRFAVFTPFHGKFIGTPTVYFQCMGSTEFNSTDSVMVSSNSQYKKSCKYVFEELDGHFILSLGLRNQYVERYNRALNHFDLLDTTRKREVILSRLACYDSLRLYHRVKREYEKVLQLPANAETPLLHNNFALLLLDRLDDPTGARKHFEIALRQNNYLDLVHLNYARLLRDHYKDFENAEYHYLMGLELSEPDPFLLHEIGTLYHWEMGQSTAMLREAKEYYNRALELKPDLTESKLQLATLPDDISTSFQDSYDAYLQALKETKDSLRKAEICFNLGVMLYFDGKGEAEQHESRNWFKKSMDMAPYDLSMLEAFQQLYIENNKEDGTGPIGEQEIKFHFERALEKYPQNRGILSLLSIVYNQGVERNPRRAITMITRLRDLVEDDAPILWNLGNLYKESGQTDEALKIFSDLIILPNSKLEDVTLSIWNFLAQFFYDQGAIEKSLISSRHAYWMDQRNCSNLNKLISLFQELDQMDSVRIYRRTAKSLKCKI